MPHVRLVLATSLALLAFAGNSLLCRLALAHSGIDAASFTTIRLLADILVLDKAFTLRLAMASASILGGIALVLVYRGN